MEHKNGAASMGEDSIARLLLRFSLPATLAMAVYASYNIVDTIFVGRLGGTAIAALSVSFPIQMLLGAIAIGTGIGAASLISRSLGAGRQDDATSAAGQVILLALVCGLIATLIGVFYLRPLLRIFGATPEIIEPTVEYMSVIANGATLMFLMMMLNHSIRAEGNAMLPMTVMLVSAGANIIMDPIFIFVFGMGIRGAAVATVLAKVLGVVIQLWYYCARRSSLNVRLIHLRPNWRIIKDIYRVGLPSLLIQISANISLIAANRILGSYGYVPIAVMGLAVRFQMFAFMPVIGIAQGVLPIIGYNFGAGKILRIREAMIKGAGAATVLVTAAGVVFFFFPRFFLGVFTKEADLLDLGVKAIKVMVLMYPLIGMQTISIVFFQAVGKGTKSLMLSLLRQFILYIPFIFFMPRLLGLSGIWMATPTADLLAFIVTISMVSREFVIQGIPLWPKDMHTAAQAAEQTAS
jgi:putative MATE family efflux protein